MIFIVNTLSCKKYIDCQWAVSLIKNYLFNSNYILANFQLPVFFGLEAQEQALEAQEQALEEQVLEVLAQRCFHYYRW